MGRYKQVVDGIICDSADAKEIKREKDMYSTRITYRGNHNGILFQVVRDNYISMYGEHYYTKLLPNYKKA